jgi:hypothetical protein
MGDRDYFDRLLCNVAGLNAKFPNGNGPFQIMTRLCEEAGELAQAVNHLERSGIKVEKYGRPDLAHLADEVHHVLRAAPAVSPSRRCGRRVRLDARSACCNPHRWATAFIAGSDPRSTAVSLSLSAERLPQKGADHASPRPEPTPEEADACAFYPAATGVPTAIPTPDSAGRL